MIWNDELKCYCINNLQAIDLQLLKQKQIKLLIFDIRGTIIDHQQIDPFFLNLISKIKQLNGFEVLFATNNCAYYTNKIFLALNSINFKAFYLSFACKPFLFRIKKAIKKMQLNNFIIDNFRQIAIIGNQLNTDGKLAKKLQATLLYLNKNGINKNY